MADVKTIVDAMDESKDCQLKKSFEVKQVTETQFLSFVVLTGLLGRHMGCEKETGESGGAGKENTKKEAVL